MHRHVVDVHRIRVLQSHAPATGHAGADTAVPGVKGHREPRLGKNFVERISNMVVGVELLERRMQLEAVDCSG